MKHDGQLCYNFLDCCYYIPWRGRQIEFLVRDYVDAKALSDAILAGRSRLAAAEKVRRIVTGKQQSRKL